MKIMKIIVRKDLKMPAGKLAVQVAHASSRLTKAMSDEVWEEFKKNDERKVVLKVKTEKELRNLSYTISYDVNIYNTPILQKNIVDRAYTFFKEPTFTCIGLFGEEDIINEFTKELKLL